MLKLELPYPPSVNHYWRHYRGRTVISDAGMQFRHAVRLLLIRQHIQLMTGPLAVSFEVYPPDRRKRDLDNLLKGLADSLEHGGAFLDDSQIIWLLIYKAEIIPGGKVIATLWELGERKLSPPPIAVLASFLNN